MVKPENCRHQNIHWDDFFKEGKVKDDGNASNNFQWHDAYCLDCSEVKGRDFAFALQRWYCKKVEEWLITNGLAKKLVDYQGREIFSCHDFTHAFLKKNDYQEVWYKLRTSRIDEDYFDAFGGQMIFFEASRWIEHLCREFQKEKDQEKPNDPNDRERGRERGKLNA